MTPSLHLIFHGTSYALCIFILQIFLMIFEVRQAIDERFLDQNRYLGLSLDNCAGFIAPAYLLASLRRVKLFMTQPVTTSHLQGFFFLYFKQWCSASLYIETLNLQSFHTVTKH